MNRSDISHQGRIRHPSFCPPSNNSNLASSNGQKSLCGSFGIQYCSLWDLRSLTHPYYRVSGIQTSTQASAQPWTLQGPMNWLQLFLTVVWEPRTTLSQRTAQKWENRYRSPGFQRKSSTTLLHKRNMSFDTLERSTRWWAHDEGWGWERARRAARQDSGEH